MDFQQILDSVLNWLTTSGVKIVLGLVVLFFLFKITNLIFGKISKSLKKKKVDLTASVVVTATLRKIVKVILVVTYLGFIGIETSSIIAAVASLGLALGLALQGSLSNLAGGIIVLVLRPFKIGDYIKCENGEEGTVENIDMYYTYIVTNDNKVITVPNSQMSTESLTNYSVKSTRRVDIVFQIAYDDDYEKARNIILQCAASTGYVLELPAPFIGMSAHASSAIEITAKLWCAAADYWPLYYAMLEKVKRAFDENGITIPFQQLDVHLPSIK